MKDIIISENKTKYGKYWLFSDKETGDVILEVDRKKEWDGYIIYSDTLEICRRKKKETAFNWARKYVRTLFPDAKFMYNAVTYIHFN